MLQILMNPVNMLTYIFFQIIFMGMPSATHKTILLNSDLENIWKIDIKIKIMSEKILKCKCLEKSENAFQKPTSTEFRMIS